MATSKKGKERAIVQEEEDGGGDSGSEFEMYSKEYLDGLLEEAERACEAEEANARRRGEDDEEEMLFLEREGQEDKPLPPLDAERLLPEPYFSKTKDRNELPKLSKDLLLDAASSSNAATPPLLHPPPMLDKQGKPMNKRQLHELRKKQSKLGYFELPVPDAAQMAKIKQEADAMRLRNSLDPKRFYRKEAVLNLKNMPKQIALGTILPTNTPFGTASAENLTRAERKRSIVEELVEDSEARRYAKRKFEELHSVHKERGRDTLNRKKLARKQKW